MPYKVYLNHHRTSSYVTDTVNTLSNIMNKFVPGEVYNIGGQEFHDMKSVSDIILSCVGRSDKIVEYVECEQFTTKDKKPDIIKAKRDLKHNPKVPLEEGIPRAIEWMREVYRPIRDE
jgi:dTDP-glucose 4,6-dehydratase